jgi:hypothetical protein
VYSGRSTFWPMKKLVQLVDGPIIIRPVTRAGRRKHTTKNYISINVTLKAMPTELRLLIGVPMLVGRKGRGQTKAVAGISGC